MAVPAVMTARGVSWANVASTNGLVCECGKRGMTARELENHLGLHNLVGAGLTESATDNGSVFCCTQCHEMFAPHHQIEDVAEVVQHIFDHTKLPSFMFECFQSSSYGLVYHVSGGWACGSCTHRLEPLYNHVVYATAEALLDHIKSVHCAHEPRISRKRPSCTFCGYTIHQGDHMLFARDVAQVRVCHRNECYPNYLRMVAHFEREANRVAALQFLYAVSRVASTPEMEARKASAEHRNTRAQERSPLALVDSTVLHDIARLIAM